MREDMPDRKEPALNEEPVPQKKGAVIVFLHWNRGGNLKNDRYCIEAVCLNQATVGNSACAGCLNWETSP